MHWLLKSYRHATHHVEACHRDVTYLVVAVGFGVGVAYDGGVDPSAGCIVTVEDVVEVEGEDGFLEE